MSKADARIAALIGTQCSRIKHEIAGKFDKQVV